ncbi:MAG: alpha/beta hydrolase, partial [Alphaproteobacteria bacterium]|nr:alpha/beta hydrolase [Alphaproteobacteria bacterium]
MARTSHSSTHSSKVEVPPAALGLHLGLMLLSMMSSPAALQHAKDGLPPWNRDLRKKSQNLVRRMGRHASAAVQSASLNRGVALLAGLKAFREAEYVRTLPDPPVIWQQGGSTLMDYGARSKAAPAVLFVPSLINRPYVLDLSERTSLLRFLHAEGIHPFLLDWGSPGAEELDFDTGAYIAMRLIPAIERVAALTQRPVALAGYCMGGMLALAAAQATPSLVSKLVLLATPWDFHSSDFRRIALDPEGTDKLNAFIRSNRFLPPEYVQNLFYVMDPWLFHRKYQR